MKNPYVVEYESMGWRDDWPEIFKDLSTPVTEDFSGYERGDPISAPQHRFIKRLLRLPFNGDYPRCKGKVGAFVRAREDAGDYTHTAKNHLCPECQCRKVAGWGTKGDFYGIGPNTGHLGVGYCKGHEVRMPPGTALRVAATELWSMILYGERMRNAVAYRDYIEADAANAELKTRVRGEIEIVYNTLQSLVDELQAKEPTEYQGGELVPISDKTRVELKLKAANVLSRLKLTDFKLDSANYLHFDELAKRYKEHLRIMRQGLMMLAEELAKEKKIANPVDYIYDWMTKEHSRIWSGVKTGVRR